jgi:hypothetical protein
LYSERLAIFVIEKPENPRSDFLVETGFVLPPGVAKELEAVVPHFARYFLLVPLRNTF